MKLNHTLGIAISATLLMSACAEIQEPQTQPLEPDQELKGNEIVFIAQEEAVQTDSKTTFGEAYKYIWEDTDKTGLYVQSAVPTTNAEATLSRSDDGKAVFTAATASAYEATDLVHAYYPYSSAAGNDPAAVKLSIPSEQNQSGSFDGMYNPMVSVPSEVGTETSVLKFRQLAAMMEFNITSSDPSLQSEHVKSLTIIENSGKNVAGSFTYDLTQVSASGEMTVPAELTGTSSRITVSRTGDLSTPVYVSLVPGTYNLTVTLLTDSDKEFVFAMKDIDCPRAYVRRFTLDLARAKTVKQGAVYDILTSKVWVVEKFGYYGEGWEYFNDPVPEYVQDDKMTFTPEGLLLLDYGATEKLYNDDGIIEVAPARRGTESWRLIEQEGTLPILRLFDGAFLAMVPSNAAMNGGDYVIASADENQIKIEYAQKGQKFVVFLKPYVKPEEPKDPTQEQVNLLTAHPWKLHTQYGCSYGTESLWDLPTEGLDEVISFKVDGKVDLVVNGKIVNDGIKGGLMDTWTVTGKESYTMKVRNDGCLFIQFSNGGFPCMMPANPGVDLLYEVRELTETSLKLYWSLGDGGYTVIPLIPAN